MKAYKNDNNGAIIVRLGKSKFNIFFIAIDYFNYATSDIFILTSYKYYYHNIKKFAKRILKKHFKKSRWYIDKSICWKAFTNWSEAKSFHSNINKTFADLREHSFEEHNRVI